MFSGTFSTRALLYDFLTRNGIGWGPAEKMVNETFESKGMFTCKMIAHSCFIQY